MLARYLQCRRKRTELLFLCAEEQVEIFLFQDCDTNRDYHRAEEERNQFSLIL